jgi:voltage-gated sodium channel
MYQKLQKISKERRARQTEEDRLAGFDHDEAIHKDCMFYEELELDKWNFLARAYVTLGLSIRFVVKNKIFDAMMNLTIVVAGVLVGLGFYPDCGPTVNSFCVDYGILATLELVIYAIFVMECFMRITMDPLRPWNYFVGNDWHWNWFDFAIVALSTPGIELDSLPYVLRLLRLARVLKLLARYKELRVILAGLAAGIKSSVWIVVLLSLVFYMFAVGFLMYFGANDPREFDGFMHTFVTLFRMATMEDWTDVTYLNWYGCTDYPIGGGVDYYTNMSGAAECTKDSCPTGYMFGPVVAGDPHGQYMQDTTQIPPVPLWREVGTFRYITECNPNPLPITALLGSVMFIFVASFIVLSMFVGSIAIAMTGLMQDMAKIQADALAARIKAGEDMGEKCAPDASIDGKLVTRDQINLLPIAGRVRFTYIEQNITAAITGTWPSTPFVVQELARMTSSIPPLLPVKHAYFSFAFSVRTMCQHWAFSKVIEFTIILAAILVGLQTDGQLDGIDTAIIDYSISIIFLIEAITKIVAEIFMPWRYFFDAWNRFDFFIVAASFLPIESGPVVALRLLRLLRVLKLMKTMPQLRVLTEALEKTSGSIMWIMVLMFMFFYISAIVAIILFQENDPWHFGNIHLALMALFRVATMEDWTDIMYINELGCDKFDSFPYVEGGFLNKQQCSKPYASGALSLMFFVGFVSFSSYVLLSLFIGIIAAEMESSQRAQVEEREIHCRLQVYCKDNFGNDWRNRVYYYERAYYLCNEMRPTQGIDLEVIQLVLSVMKEDPPGDNDKAISAWFLTNAKRPPWGQLNLYDFAYFLDNLPWRPGNESPKYVISH